MMSIIGKAYERSSLDGTLHSEIALTFDDLPAVIYRRKDVKGALLEVIQGLIRHLSDSSVPATGFVNEYMIFRNERGELRRDGSCDEARVKVLEIWLDAGLNLGNHTFSHMSLHEAKSVNEYKDDILRGEIITAALLKERGQRLRYFRHPYLETGQDMPTRIEVARFLAENGYRIAPVTISTQDYKYGMAYENAIMCGNWSLAKWIVDEYIKYISYIIEYYRKISLGLFGRNISQILLLHANLLNASCLDQLISMIKGQGYAFIELDQALRDPAYLSEDFYTGREGIGWLERWGISRGYQCPYSPPEIPDHIVSAFEQYNRALMAASDQT
ncbi:polysaccharide deacetylase-like protein [Burkholderia sp. Bp9126]|nr:polysaccharide deacetylase-like protein [Burkholderia sp. Bp9126]